MSGEMDEMMDTIMAGAVQEKKLKFMRKVSIRHEDVICDPLKVHEIFLNILSNAVKYTILLAEDNELNAEITVTILKNEGISAEVAADGEQAVKMLEEAPDGYYDLILMDVQMPRMNGYDATRQIRKLRDQKKASIPVIAMTANAFEEDRNEAFAAGMDEHVAKPVEIKKLMNKIVKCIRK